MIYKPPFPWFGGKSRAANIVWERFGDVKNYVEPFFGSGAVMFMRPHEPNIETVNDKDCYLANFFRAIKNDPDQTASFASNPVNEADLLARHRWLMAQSDFTDKMRIDPDYYDCKIAGWWVWGICCWIGSGWCKNQSEQIPHLGTNGLGINRKLPHLGDNGRGIIEYFEYLSNRLRSVRVCCGDWTRVLGPSVTFKHGVTGIFFDPPYAHDKRDKVYSVDEDISFLVKQWAIENGSNPMLRIALCGYFDEHEMPSEWTYGRWLPNGGFSNQSTESDAKQNKFEETIWFSPHCLNKKQKELFAQ